MLTKLHIHSQIHTRVQDQELRLVFCPTPPWPSLPFALLFTSVDWEESLAYFRRMKTGWDGEQRNGRKSGLASFFHTQQADETLVLPLSRSTAFQKRLVPIPAEGAKRY